MEDPWANAWEEPTNSQSDSQNEWGQDPQIDIVTPSWPTSNGVKWTELPDVQQSLWNAHSSVKDWNPSPYDSTSLKVSSQVELTQSDRPPSPITAEEISSPQPSSLVLNGQSLESASLPDDEPPIARSRSLTPSSLGSPDAFGTFETGLDVDEAGVDPWGYSADLPVPGSSETDPTWGEDKYKVKVEGDNGPVDEWEAAKRSKERQDRHVVRSNLCHSLNTSDDIAAARSIELDTWSI
jgi:hypothetical protein